MENRVLQCYICKLYLKNKFSNLRRHVNLHSASVKCFKCLECNETFQNKSNWKIHWSRKHDNPACRNVPPNVMETIRPSTRKLNFYKSKIGQLLIEMCFRVSCCSIN